MLDLDRVEALLDRICSESVSNVSHPNPHTTSDSKRHLESQEKFDDQSSKPSKKQKSSPPQLFITNIPFSVTQQSLRAFLDSRCIPCEGLHLGRDSQGKFQGWSLVTLPPSADPASLVSSVDGAEFQDRVLYCSLGGEKTEIEFRLPFELIDRLRRIKDERSLSGSPAGRLADGYRRVYGEKFPAEKYGFRSFVSALESIEGVSLSLDPRTNQTICTWP